MLGTIHHISCTLFSEAVSQSNTEFVKMASLDSQLALGILFLPSESGIIGRPLCPPGIYMGSGVPNIGLHPCMAST